MKEYKKGDKVLYNGKTMTVTDVKPKGWTDDVVVSDGTENHEINEYDCVYAPDGNVTDEVSRLHGYLSKNNLYAEVGSDKAYVYVHIEWGDWKHDHGFADRLMSLVGYRRVRVGVTEDNGSDCYSATHVYLKPAA